MKGRRFVCFVAASLLLLCAACAGDGEVVSPTGEIAETYPPPPAPVSTYPPAPTPKPTPSPDPFEGMKGVNPLTGLPMDEAYGDRRPAAVMLNNLKQALPMYGVSRADIIYEAPAEGGITRMLGVYQDPSQVEQIGSVRSTRAYYLDLAQGHDAILLHAGYSEEARMEIKNRGVTNMDCLSGYEGTLYWRDQERIRTRGLEHSAFTSGERIEEAYSKLKGRTEYATGFRQGLLFSDDGTPRGGTPAVSISIEYSTYKTGLFEYDPLTGRYDVSQYGAPFIDGLDDSRVSVTNVIIIYAKIWNQGDKDGHLSIDLVSSGEGLFACGGRVIPLIWSKASHSAPFVYTLQDGSPLRLGRGRSFVNIVSRSYKVDIE